MQRTDEKPKIKMKVSVHILEIASRIIKNATIYTVDSDFTVASAMAVKGNQILYVGDNAGVESYIGPETEITDLQGKVVTPAFFENHIHFRQYGEMIARYSCRGKSKEQILSEVAELVKEMEPGQWLVSGEGWINDYWEDPSYPTLEELDAVSPNNPVLLPRLAGATLWANSLALKAAGIDRNEEPWKSYIMVNSDGTPSGCFCDRKVREKLNEQVIETEETARKNILAAQEKMFEFGIGGIFEASQGGKEIKRIRSMYESGEMKLRFSAALQNAAFNKLEMDPETREVFENGPYIGEFDDHFTVRAVKMAAGGTVGTLSATHYEEFCDDPGNFGKANYTDEQMFAAVMDAAKHGYQVAIHAIGDKDIDQVLDTYEKVNEIIPIKDLRFRIEHFQLVRGNTPERAKALGVVPSMQAMHAPNSAGMAMRRLGADRASRAYAIGMVQRRVGLVAGGSDAPVATASIMSGIHASVARTNDFLEPKGGFFPENGMTREDALRSYTIWGAYAQFCEDRRGSLEVGKYADYAILDGDFMKMDIDDILNVKVVETVVGGETVYKV